MTLPTDSQRITIVGRTGSGKTQAALWHLSMRSWDVRPWVIYDYKVDKSIAQIPGLKHISITDPIPVEPGIYAAHPQPKDSDFVEKQMWEIWQHENIGVYIDEGYMVSSGVNINEAFRSLLTQGRSKSIPIITLSQRPVGLDRFVFSESDYYQVFALNDKEDRKTMMRFVPADLTTKLPRFHSYYYEVSDGAGGDKLLVVKPIPTMARIVEMFRSRLPKDSLNPAVETKPHKVVFI